jgi:hypothetical protein
MVSEAARRFRLAEIKSLPIKTRREHLRIREGA